MGFFEKILAFFAKKKSAVPTQLPSLAIIARLNDLEKNVGFADPHDAIAIKNVAMIMRAVSDKYNTYSADEISEMSGVINAIIGDIENTAMGVGSSSGFDVKPLSLSTKNYIALLAYYMNQNIRSGKKNTSMEEMNDRRAAVKSAYDNEVLGIRLEEEKKKLISKKKELADLDKSASDILAKISEKRESDPEIPVLIKEHQVIKSSIAKCQNVLEMINKSIGKIGNQIVQNEHYATLLEETAVLREALAHQSYGSLEELQTAIDTYKAVDIETDTVQQVADEMFAQLNNTGAKEEVYDPELEAALKRAKENEKKAQTKAEDAANFGFNAEAEVHND